jgi:hypothetical protein
MTLLPMDEFVTLIEGPDVSIPCADAESVAHFVEAKAVAAPPHTFDHCGAHVATEKGDRQGLIFVRRGGSEIAPMPLKMIILVPSVKEAMDLWHFSPGFDGGL